MSAVGGESIIAAAVGALAGGGGVKALGALLGPQRDSEIADYYRGVIHDVLKENAALRRQAETLAGELAGARARVLSLELAQDRPPPHLA